MMPNLIAVGDKVLNFDDLLFIQPTKGKRMYHCFFKSTEEILWLQKNEAEAVINWLLKNQGMKA